MVFLYVETGYKMKSKRFTTCHSFLLIFIFYSFCLAAKVETVQIFSDTMKKSFPAIIVLPDNYNQKNLPVVYLLHGYSGSYRDWMDKANLDYLTDRFQLIIVCPDGGYAGWYIDGPQIHTSQYETYIALEVVNYVDKHYPTIPNKNNRALCGLSMGGHGALSLLAKYPERFGSAGSISGLMNLESQKEKYQLTSILGKIEDFPDRWAANSSINLVERLKNKKIGLIIDCGIEDPFIDGNRLLHQKLIDLNIDHDYYERAGGHTWDYWVNALDFHLLFFSKRWKKK